MSGPLEFDESTSLINGAHGKLCIQTRDGKPSQLTLAISNTEGLSELFRDSRNCKSAFGEVTQIDILLAAITMTQQSAMVLNVNAFIASTYCLVPIYSHGLILDALRELFEWAEIGFPFEKLDDILDECQAQ